MGGKLNAFFQAVKEPLPQFHLELLNLLAQGRLGNVAMRGGPREGSLPGHRHEITELMHFHRLCLW
jgi:hypothetical protein